MTIIEKEINKKKEEGYNIYKISSGLISPNTNKSKLGKAIKECEKNHSNVIYVVGGRAGYHLNDGSHWAVMYK